MSYNGSGVFNINTAGQPVVTGTVISSTAFNALTADLATGLTTALTKDGQTTPTANIPMGGFKITGIAAATTLGDALSYGRAATVSTLTNSALTSGRVPYASTAGLLTDSANLTFNGTTLTANTIGAYTLSGTVAGGGNQINNVIIGTSTPLAGAFTSITGTSITDSGLTSGRVTYATTGGLLTDSSGLTYDGTNLNIGTSTSVTNRLLNVQGSSVAKPVLVQTTTTNSLIEFNDSGTATKPAMGSVGDALTFWPAGVEGMRLTSTGLGIGVTSPACILDISGASGGQIKFPATQNASSDANTLDDYEEGTWTPNQGAGLTVVGTFSSTGAYTKIGNLVNVQVSLSGSTSIAIGSSDAIMLTNLPFATANRSPGEAINIGHNAGIFTSTSSSTVYSCGSLVATTTIYLSITYRV